MDDTVMISTPETQASDLLLVLAAPLRLVEWLEKVFAQKRDKGQEVPENFIKWLERWQRIRTDLPSGIDGVAQSDWIAVERKVFGVNHNG